MGKVLPLQRVCISKDRRGLFKWDTMLFEI